MVKNTIKNKNISILQGFGISIFNPKIFIWFIAIYSQFMGPNTTILYDLILVFTAGIIDASWYIFLSIMATTTHALQFINRNIDMFQKLIGIFFIILGSFLFINTFLIF